ncbi:hypothetical protein KAS08_01380 [Candidatus Pacearchaeota archaeon]|nr:hypothetical protein [Candidatus Pacearchaeota archaeon]
MKITFTIDSILSNKLDGSDSAEHWDTYHLIKEAENRGHDVRMVQSEDAIIGKGFSKELYLNNNKIIYRDFTLPDALMIRGYGMRVGKECFDNLVDTVKSIEENISLVVNSSSATAYSRKDNQKKLPLPFIPSYDINGEVDVNALLKEHKDGIILKPVYGLQGNGVEFIKNTTGLENLLRTGAITEDDLKNDYIVEQFIPNQKEIRHIYLFNERVGSRVAEKIGSPARESLGNRYLLETPNKKHLEIAREAMDLTGIKYGCIDFRGDYVLEINGSGTQTFYRDKMGSSGKIFLDLNKNIIDKLESNFKKLN